MKKRDTLLPIYFVVLSLAFSSCHKNTFETSQAQTQSAISPTKNKNSIKEIDFKNFTYPDETGKNIFTLNNGEDPFGQMKDIAFKLENIEYADLTNDGEDEAIIRISIQYGGSDKSGLLYIYALENNEPQIMWYVESGYGAEGELKKAFAENSNLIVEFFGDVKFDEVKGEFKFPNPKIVSKDLCCPTGYTKFRFKWSGEKFVVLGKPELLRLKKSNGKN